MLAPRSFRISSSCNPRSSPPSKRMFPEFTVAPRGSRPSTESAVKDLPDPDSPTSPRQVPASRAKPTDFSTCFDPNEAFRPSISSRGITPPDIEVAPQTFAKTVHQKQGSQDGKAGKNSEPP